MEDILVVDVTGNTAVEAVVNSSHVKRVIVIYHMQVHLITHVKIKIDTIDSGVIS
ncbi:hypothetical protein MFUM_700033 [Methylacidiphilum fumariolicum SolV]|uniref:REJ domain-containing protein n=2 Tax=Candidatus Methylacidiphilum fumarolicum TaxID=591154 RepID=I0JZ15_METFB|nr:REJ domain-containing protein [Candidatus Methylacidiphilum fumarolicum]CCG92484.1 hypothetical protein MFUM_700033 [Methylacidiphilum fumariolicum SolV]